MFLQEDQANVVLSLSLYYLPTLLMLPALLGFLTSSWIKSIPGALKPVNTLVIIQSLLAFSFITLSFAFLDRPLILLSLRCAGYASFLFTILFNVVFIRPVQNILKTPNTAIHSLPMKKRVFLYRIDQLTYSNYFGIFVCGASALLDLLAVTGSIDYNARGTYVVYGVLQLLMDLYVNLLLRCAGAVLQFNVSDNGTHKIALIIKEETGILSSVASSKGGLFDHAFITLRPVQRT